MPPESTHTHTLTTTHTVILSECLVGLDPEAVCVVRLKSRIASVLRYFASATSTIKRQKKGTAD